MVLPVSGAQRMPTTSLKLPDDLKTRASSAARARGVSTHAFMIEAIREAATAAEARARFVADAKAARKVMLKSGKGYASDDVHAYLRAHASGKASRKPAAKSWRS